MKVGLVVEDVSPTDGGGYTFIREVLAALLAVQGSTEHELIVFYRHRSPIAAELLVRGSNAVDLDALRPMVMTFDEQVVRLLPAGLRRVAARLRRSSARPRWDERVYLREGIEFLVHLAPHGGITKDIPYGVTLWDLQHRLNPWFPEVSSIGEWAVRDVAASNLLRRASIIYVGTQEGRRQIEYFYRIPCERIQVLPSPAPEFALAAADAATDPGIVRKLGITNEYLFYPAQFWPHKNHVVVLEACQRIRSQTGWDLGVVFSGTDKGNLQYVRDYARRLGLEHRAVFAGFVDEALLIQLYKNAFCLVYPTFCGPEGLPPMEAFALGCPVVASAIPGAAEQLGNAALFHPAADEHALANAILSLRSTALRKALVAAGRSHATAARWNDYARGIIASLDRFAGIRRCWGAKAKLHS
jgi:glycosyltransferase involved in cell wall biosynthesis